MSTTKPEQGRNEPTWRVVANTPLPAMILEQFGDRAELLPWTLTEKGSPEPIDGIYTFGHVPVDAAVLDRLPGARVISAYGVGVDHIDVAAATKRGVAVGHTPGYLDGATADIGFALLLAAARRVVEGDCYARSPEFTRFDPGYMLGIEVHSTTLGIVGLGRVGWQVARRARGFDMKVLYHNRRRRDDAEHELDARHVSLDDLLKQSDYVILCCPLTEETRNLIDASALAKMKPTAMLINIARGGVVDTNALYQAVKNGQIAGAGLDVTEPEPLPRDHPLLGLNNVTMVPHLGSATLQTRTKMAEVSVANLFAGMRGEPLLHQFNL